jgi:hypothetical protein
MEYVSLGGTDAICLQLLRLSSAFILDHLQTTCIEHTQAFKVHGD